MHLRKRSPGADLESYAAIHQGVIFGALTLVTGSIWARISWGVWWTWSSNQLVTFLILFLFYSAYFMLRYSVEPGPGAREHVRGLRAVRSRADPGQLALDPARERLHPPDGLHERRAADVRARCSSRSASPGSGCSTLAGTMYRVELAGKRLDERMRELRELLA